MGVTVLPCEQQGVGAFSCFPQFLLLCWAHQRQLMLHPPPSEETLGSVRT